MNIGKHVICEIMKRTGGDPPRKGKSGHNIVLQIVERLFQGADTAYAV